MSTEIRRKAQNFQVLGALSKPAMALAICGLLMSSLFAVGCSIVAQEQGSTAGETSVILPWVKDGKYSAERVNLHNLLNISSLKSSLVVFLLGPSISNSKLVGFQPRVRTFVDAQGSHMPTDNVSIQLLSLYAHMEKLNELDRQMGLGDLLPKPRVVGYDVRLSSSRGRRDQTENNALYVPTLDAYLFVPFKGDDLPIAVNGGVIAHEHFHALFNYMVLNTVRKKIKTVSSRVHLEEEKDMAEHFPELESKITVPEPSEAEVRGADEWENYHDNLLRGINEGLADVWGWVYSGDTIFVRRSLPGTDSTRDLDVRNLKIYAMEDFRAYSRGAKLTGTTRYSYELGTQYARTLKAVFTEMIDEKKLPRSEAGRLIVKVLPKLEKQLMALDTSEWMKPMALVELFAEELREDHPKLCESLMRVSPGIQELEVQNFCTHIEDTPKPTAATTEKAEGEKL